jgi:dephospho-CoA kinase
VRILEIVESRESWAADFKIVAARVRLAFGALALRVDHIGSTSVPGLDAKDIIDIQVTVSSLAPTAPIVDALARSGMTFREHLTDDHQPLGASSAQSGWTKLVGSTPGRGAAERQPAQVGVNVHVRVAGNPNQRYALLFRDYLRHDAAVAATYALIKRELAKIAPGNFDAYYAVKDPVCDLVMAAAERWAQQTEWSPGPSGA